MDAELKSRWCEALRSGKYKQGPTFLKRDGKYCCLGVLGEIAGIDVGEERSFLRDKTGKMTLVPESLQYDLSAMNDGGQHTFETIADFIEQTL